MSLTFGTDVELPIKDNTGKLISAVGLIGGDKDHPVWFDDFNLQEDNTNVEFAINPVTNVEDWIGYIKKAMNAVDSVLAPNGLHACVEASGIYDEDQLRTKASMKFGCDPDISVYTGNENIAPKPEDVGGLRSAGGHVHVGYSDVIDPSVLVYSMDMLLGIPSVLLDQDTRRRSLYGSAGAYRSKPYGVEYRTLSNFWVRDEETMRWVFEQTVRAVELAKSEAVLEFPSTINPQHCIDHYDKRSAESAVEWLTKSGYM